MKHRIYVQLHADDAAAEIKVKTIPAHDGIWGWVEAVDSVAIGNIDIYMSRAQTQELSDALTALLAPSAILGVARETSHGLEDATPQSEAKPPSKVSPKEEF